MAKSDGLRWCSFCHSHYLGGWCPLCDEQDRNNISRTDRPARKLDREEINTRARKAAEDAFIEPLKVPLAEASNTGGMESMSLQVRREAIKGVPPVIADILANYPQGLTSQDVLNGLKEKRVFPAHLPRLAATQHLNSMQEKGWVEKHGGSRTTNGPLWRLTGKPINYSPTGAWARAKTAKKKVRKLKQQLNGSSNGAHKPKTQHADTQQLLNAITTSIDGLRALADMVADIETREFKLQQREKAVEAARKLLLESA